MEHESIASAYTPPEGHIEHGLNTDAGTIYERPRLGRRVATALQSVGTRFGEIFNAEMPSGGDDEARSLAHITLMNFQQEMGVNIGNSGTWRISGFIGNQEHSFQQEPK